MARLFPYEKIRRGQTALLRHISKALQERKPMLVHAPTGMGKTVASLAPAMETAIANDLTVFFLTSRHTQHLIALDTVSAIKSEHGVTAGALSVVGKKHMCLQPGVGKMGSGEFSEFCKNLRMNDQCTYYLESKNKAGMSSVKSEICAKNLLTRNVLPSEAILKEAEIKELCPYELAMDAAKKGKVIVTDYYYLFSPKIRDRFLKKMGLTLDKCILIIDEGHNLPDRIRGLFSDTLTTYGLGAAKKEAEKFGYETLERIVGQIHDIIIDIGKGQEEKLVARGDFIKRIQRIMDYAELVKKFEDAGEHVTLNEKKSSLSHIGEFLESWIGEDEGYARIVSCRSSPKGETWQLSYKCLDPSLISGPVIKDSYWTLLMSGTLNPPEMYRDLLGFPDDALCQEYDSPFTEENRLALIVPHTTTKYDRRSEDMFKKMAYHIDNMVQHIPGNTAVFFPSYSLRDQVYKYLETNCPKTMFLEDSKLTKADRQDLLERFKSYKDTGAVLLGVSGGSFGEGVDLPGDLLKGVIVVGLPLGRPDLETNELIKYYDEKFGEGHGRSYGYIMPAFTKTLQNAGRCIRSESDKGVVVFLDERYDWSMYKRCLPGDWGIRVSTNYLDPINEFFDSMK